MSSTIRKEGYKDHEDINLCHCYIDVSQNPIIGRNQTKDKFWTRVETQYHATEPFTTNPRPRRSLETRMSCILKATKKIRGCINQVQNRNPSGASEQDIMNDAKEMLKLDASYKKGFKFDHVWHLMKDFDHPTNVTLTQYQRQSPYQSPSPGYGSSSGTDAGLPSLNLNDEQGDVTLTQRPIGVKKAKSKLQSDNKIDTMVKASKRIGKAIERNNDMMLKRYEAQIRLADDKIMFTDLNSITDPVSLEFMKSEKIRIMKKRTEEPQVDTYGQGSEYQGSQYRASQHQGSGEEEVQEQVEGSQDLAEGSQDVAGNFSHYVASGNNWTF